jgi:hypothetical protein
VASREIIVLSLIPRPPELIPVENGDEAEHVLAYGILMFRFAPIYVRQRGRMIAAALAGRARSRGRVRARPDRVAGVLLPDMAVDALGVGPGWLPRARPMC